MEELERIEKIAEFFEQYGDAMHNELIKEKAVQLITNVNSLKQRYLEWFTWSVDWLVGGIVERLSLFFCPNIPFPPMIIII